MPSEIGRTDRGFQRGNEPPFTPEQRIYLLERDLDVFEQESSTDRRRIRESIEELREEIRATEVRTRKTVGARLNVLVAIGFSLLLAIISVLVTVVVNRGP